MAMVQMTAFIFCRSCGQYGACEFEEGTDGSSTISEKLRCEGCNGSSNVDIITKWVSPSDSVGSSDARVTLSGDDLPLQSLVNVSDSVATASGDSSSVATSSGDSSSVTPPLGVKKRSFELLS